jgi:hypothetical protein
METQLVPVVVFDLATLRFRRSAKRTSMSVIAASGEVLAVVDTVGHDSNADAAFAACEHALSAGRVRRDGTIRRVVLYNPYTAQASYGPAVDAVIFGGEPLAVEIGGSCGMVQVDGPESTLDVAGVVRTAVQVSVAAASRAFLANRDQER